MAMFRLIRPLIVFVAVACASCTTMTPASNTDQVRAADSPRETTLPAEYEALAKSGAKVIRIDPARSSVRIYVFRGGRATRLGHNHVMSAPEFTGFLAMHDGMSDVQFDLEFRLDKLEIDKPEYRASLGKAFASVPTVEAIAGTREHMLGADGMQADTYPLVSIHSLHITGEMPKFAAQVRVDMHGQSREMWIPLTAEGLPDSLSAAGSFVIRQSDFGIKPYSVMGGLLAVQDEVIVEFRLTGG